MIPRGKTGYYGLVGPGLAEGVDEEKLTANAPWEAVTGKPGTQTWYEGVHITCRSPRRPGSGRSRRGARVCQPGRDVVHHRRPDVPWPRVFGRSGVAAAGEKEVVGVLVNPDRHLGPVDQGALPARQVVGDGHLVIGVFGFRALEAR